MTEEVEHLMMSLFGMSFCLLSTGKNGFSVALGLYCGSTVLSLYLPGLSVPASADADSELGANLMARARDA